MKDLGTVIRIKEWKERTNHETIFAFEGYLKSGDLFQNFPYDIPLVKT